MKIAFLADPLDSFKIWKDSTYAMMVEAARRGHEVHAFEQKDMAMQEIQKQPRSGSRGRFSRVCRRLATMR